METFKLGTSFATSYLLLPPLYIVEQLVSVFILIFIVWLVLASSPGQGGVSPSAVADAMVGAVVDFVRKKHPKFVCSVKILIFQTAMIAEFHNSMKKRQGEEVAEKSVLNKFIGIILLCFMWKHIYIIQRSFVNNSVKSVNREKVSGV